VSEDHTERTERPEVLRLIVEQNPQARIAYEIVQQLEPYLPIASLDQLTERTGEVVVAGQRLPVRLFSRHISPDLFPVVDLEDLVRKVSSAVRRADRIVNSSKFPLRNPALVEIANSLQAGPGARRGTPVGYLIGRSAAAGVRLEGGNA
jgi:hypothetical protein